MGIPLKMTMVTSSEDFHTRLLKEHESYRYWETREELKRRIEEIFKGKGEKMKPFDLEAALAGKPVVTRDGRKVREIIAFKADIMYPVLAIFEGDNSFSTFTKDGRFLRNGTIDHVRDLFMAELEKEIVLSDEVLDRKMDLIIDGWNGNPVHCVYLNNHRIVGTKPWGGGTTTKSWNYLTIRELAKAIPELRSVLGLDYLGRPLAKAESEQK